jgi:hypothetical protein
MTTEIHRAEDGNDRIKEGRNGRDYHGTATRVVWLVVQDGNTVEAFDRLKDARSRYPAAPIIRDPYA